MQGHHDRPSKRRRQAPPDPIKRSMRRDLAATLERDYARELAHERRAVALDRFWNRRYA